MNQESHIKTDAAQLQQVEKLLHGATSWEPDTPAPADLCARVTQRIAGRPARSRSWFVYAPVGLVAGGAFVFAAMALLPGPALQAPVVTGEVATNRATASTTPVRIATPPFVAADTEMGNRRMLAGSDTSAETQNRTTIVSAKRDGDAPHRNRARAVRSLHRGTTLPRKRNSIQYASRDLAPGLQSQPKILAEGPYPQEWGPQDDMVALVPVVLADYEQLPTEEGAPHSMQATLTPAVVAVSLKQDAFGEVTPSPTPVSQTPLPEPEVPAPTPTAIPIENPQ